MQAVKHMAIYLGSSLLAKAIPFLLLPVLTTYLSTASYGAWSIFQVLLAFMVPMVGMNLHNNITRHFFTKAKPQIAAMLANMTWIVLANAAAAEVLIFGFRRSLEGWLCIPAEWLLLLPVIAAMSALKNDYLTLLRNAKRAWRFGALEVASTAVTFAAAVMLIVWFGRDWEGMAGALTFSALLFGPYALLMTVRSGFFARNWDRETIRALFVVSLPFVPHALGGVVINMSDRLFIDQMLGKEAVGIYSVGAVFGMSVSVVMAAFNKTWSPWMHEQLAHIDDRKKRKIVRLTYLLAGAIFVLPAAVWALAVLVMPYVIDKTFFGAREYIAWIAYGYAVQSLYFLVFPYLIHTGKTAYLTKITVTAALINLLANYLLIRQNGAVGAAQATVIAYAVMSLGIWYHATRVYTMPWKGKSCAN